MACVGTLDFAEFSRHASTLLNNRSKRTAPDHEDLTALDLDVGVNVKAVKNAASRAHSLFLKFSSDSTSDPDVTSVDASTHEAPSEGEFRRRTLEQGVALTHRTRAAFIDTLASSAVGTKDTPNPTSKIVTLVDAKLAARKASQRAFVQAARKGLSTFTGSMPNLRQVLPPGQVTAPHRDHGPYKDLHDSSTSTARSTNGGLAWSHLRQISSQDQFIKGRAWMVQQKSAGIDDTQGKKVKAIMTTLYEGSLPLQLIKSIWSQLRTLDRDHDEFIVQEGHREMDSDEEDQLYEEVQRISDHQEELADNALLWEFESARLWNSASMNLAQIEEAYATLRDVFAAHSCEIDPTVQLSHIARGLVILGVEPYKVDLDLILDEAQQAVKHLDGLCRPDHYRMQADGVRLSALIASKFFRTLLIELGVSANSYRFALTQVSSLFSAEEAATLLQECKLVKKKDGEVLFDEVSFLSFLELCRFAFGRSIHLTLVNFESNARAV